MMSSSNSMDERISAVPAGEVSTVTEEEAEDHRLRLLINDGIRRNDAAAVQQALQIGASSTISEEDENTHPLCTACGYGNEEIVRLLLTAGADAHWKDSTGWSAILSAGARGHLSTVQRLIDHDRDLLEIADCHGRTPLLIAIEFEQADVVRFLLDHGANVLATGKYRRTPLMVACEYGHLETVRQVLLASTGIVENVMDARDRLQKTALHYAIMCNHVPVALELILQHNANLLARDDDGRTPFALAYYWGLVETLNPMLEMYGTKLEHTEGGLALHVLLSSSEYLVAENCPLRIRLPLGNLTLEHLRTLMQALDTELIRNRDDNGKLPIHIACLTNAPVEVLALLVELHPATLQMADHQGALPLHDYCSKNDDWSRVRNVAEQGGFDTLAARNREGTLPLHVFCGSINPSFVTVQYLIQAFPRSVMVRTNAGDFPFMLAACDTSSASLSVVYELMRAAIPVLVFSG